MDSQHDEEIHVATAEEQKPYGVIYAAVNLVNGHKYVGKTSRELRLRVAEHEYDARNKNKTAFSKAITKYGIGAFVFGQIEECSEDDLDYREQYWIMRLRCRKPHGYNLTIGGDGCLGLKRPDVTARLKAMTGERNHRYGKKYTEEEKSHFREKSLGKNNARYGVKLSEEQRRLISERTKEAMQRPDVRDRHARALAQPGHNPMRGKWSRTA